MFAAGSERSSGAPAQPERPPPPLPPPRFQNNGVWQWETAPLNTGNLVIINASIPLPLLFTTNSFMLESQLYELVTERSQACAAFLQKSLHRAINGTTIGWSVTDNYQSNVTCNSAWLPEADDDHLLIVSKGSKRGRLRLLRTVTSVLPRSIRGSVANARGDFRSFEYLDAEESSRSLRILRSAKVFWIPSPCVLQTDRGKT